MKRVESTATVCFLLALLAGVVSCRPDRDVILDELAALERSSYEDLKRGERDLDRKTEEELLAGIRFLEDEVNRTVNAGVHLGTYYKLVAIKYRDRELYGLASEYFDKALGIYPTNPYLAYWAGVCAGQRARASQTADTRSELFEQARRYYEYAIELDPRYTDALYALAVLLVFEFEELESAERYLERVLAIESLDYSAMGLLARVYVSFGRIEDAIDLYQQIEKGSNVDSMVEQAKRNREELSGGGYGR